MKHVQRTLTATALSLAFAFPIGAAAAEADEHTGHHPEKSAAAGTAPAAAPATDTRMDDLRTRMRALREERDPQKRMAMMDMQKKDMAAMMEQMGMAGGGMMGAAGGKDCMMMGRDGKTPMKAARGKGMPSGMGGGMHGMTERHMEMMDMRMEMMQMMMEQMATQKHSAPSPTK